MIFTYHIESDSIQEEGPTEDTGSYNYYCQFKMRPIIHNVCTDYVGSYSGITCHPGGPLGPPGTE